MLPSDLRTMLLVSLQSLPGMFLAGVVLRPERVRVSGRVEGWSPACRSSCLGRGLPRNASMRGSFLIWLASHYLIL